VTDHIETDSAGGGLPVERSRSQSWAPLEGGAFLRASAADRDEYVPMARLAKAVKTAAAAKSHQATLFVPNAFSSNSSGCRSGNSTRCCPGNAVRSTAHRGFRCLYRASVPASHVPHEVRDDRRRCGADLGGKRLPTLSIGRDQRHQQMARIIAAGVDCVLAAEYVRRPVNRIIMQKDS
jgi:hypothetical protein